MVMAVIVAFVVVVVVVIVLWTSLSLSMIFAVLTFVSAFVVIAIVVVVVVAASGAVNVICCAINNNVYLWWERLPLVVAYAIAAGLVSCSLHGLSFPCLTSLHHCEWILNCPWSVVAKGFIWMTHKRRLSKMVIVGRSKSDSLRINNNG